MTGLNQLRQRKATLLNQTGNHDVIMKWDIKDLVGLDNMTAKDVWDATSHELNKMIKEVQKLLLLSY